MGHVHGPLIRMTPIITDQIDTPAGEASERLLKTSTQIQKFYGSELDRYPRLD